MSYPKYDFRYLLTQQESDDKLIKALSREPMIEILRSWNYLAGKESLSTLTYLYDIYKKAILRAVSLNRFNYQDLRVLLDNLMFRKSVLDGLLEYWYTLPIWITGSTMMVGTHCEHFGIPLEFTKKEKNIFINMLLMQDSDPVYVYIKQGSDKQLVQLMTTPEVQSKVDIMKKYFTSQVSTSIS